MRSGEPLPVPPRSVPSDAFPGRLLGVRARTRSAPTRAARCPARRPGARNG